MGKQSGMQKDETQGQSGRGTWWQESVSMSRPLETRLQIKYHLCLTLCPQLTTVKVTAEQTASIWTGWCWVKCLLHMLPNKKRRTEEVPFHIRHRTKLTPRTDSRRKWVLPGFCFFAITSIDYRDSSTLFMTENPTVVQNKIVNSNFYSYTILQNRVEMIALVECW